ncbi:MAG TPA: hydroxymethylbilane synthase [Methanoregulaceae archaeon]|nr:hydroxymethylbilane synthase [Methanoregulaceae archaeon]HQJ86938.1 hydroxymethylbilane synthase [Methanoregulaceae archaeon]
MPLVIGTRGSALALAQAERVRRLLKSAGIETDLKVIATAGDEVTGVPLHEIGGQGVFVRALDDAILKNECDCAVHSMKDIPAVRPHGVSMAAVLARDSPSDFLATHAEAPKVIGSSSTRRRAQLLRHDPDCSVQSLRGNVDTRLRRLSEGRFDAIVLAEAGLERLNLRVEGRRLDPREFVPSTNQGTIAVVSRDDPRIVSLLAQALDDPTSRRDTLVERAVMEELGGGCFTPIGCWCADGHLVSEVLSLDGDRWVRKEAEIGGIDEARTFGRALRKEAAGLIREAFERLRLRDGG